ncbi:MAG: hypothetical protein HY912_05455 [Desulfomonile tiedjei]|uniref:Neuromedin U n=1 Tax=Desulfomonile tiedjei TaxID=2358 RepID=A0A9D6Z2U3_9BACT|nr:hypothetical protein [Desulfomonile tiedjei]
MRPSGFIVLKKRFPLRSMWAVLAVCAGLMLSPTLSAAQEGNIARDLANPFSSLWSIVNQINFNQLKGGLFKESHTQFNWNLQPVMPLPLNGLYNLINRPVFPYYKNPYLDSAGEIAYASGLGDIQLASLIVPNKTEGIIYGLGVTLIAPTAKDSVHIGQGLWQAGPTAGLFYVSKQFVAGVFPQHWHAVSGVDNEHPSTRLTNLQYAVSYLPTPELTIFTSNNILIDWTKDPENRWTVPVGIGVSYLFTFGKMPISIGINYQTIVKHPADLPHQESIVRLTFTPVIPSPFAKKEE